jgi:hypothetical protein
MAPPGADLRFEGEMRLEEEEPMAGADAPEPEVGATTGLGADTAVSAPEQAATIQTASSVPQQVSVLVFWTSSLHSIVVVHL